MSKLRILYAASEIAPFLTTSYVADLVRALPQYAQEKELEVRILVPRFGVINERKNRLHEVVRLSGLNIPVGDQGCPLLIKVASIPQAKLQVYFIDNEEFFKRKAVFYDKGNAFFEDNAARMVFFCKGVLETVRKLGWPPDVVHCHDWFSSLIPLYLKTAYRQDPTLKKAKLLFTLYNNAFTQALGANFSTLVKMTGLPDKELVGLQNADFSALMHTITHYSDQVVKAEALSNPAFRGVLAEEELTCLANDEAGLEAYYQRYKKLVGGR